MTFTEKQSKIMDLYKHITREEIDRAAYQRSMTPLEYASSMLARDMRRANEPVREGEARNLARFLLAWVIHG